MKPLGVFPPLQGNLVEWLTAITLAAGLVTAAWRWIGRPIRDEWVANRTFQAQFRADWHGTPDRPGVPGRAGVLEALDLLASERTSMQERLAALEARTERHSQDIGELRADLTALDSVITRD